ncbi:MAG: GNAT family N-acetyltransferase [Methanocalculus sp. MSAO_Arc2]|uniref:GNAT family N-acetyltransferase n=1 Tax=Methanocalculus sp. MSAO_Arc2 TaxID=2293855 RepID=UPI000FF2FD86|nr:MAG: GNAT family N-acetyltransferase [Methanocalculus sp. MSAO_Arc2]
MEAIVRELKPEEYALAETIWQDFRKQKADPVKERIFVVYDNGEITTTARCTRHSDGLEMDCIFTPEQYRGKGYAHLAISALLEACGKEVIYTHSPPPMTSFFEPFGFQQIDQQEMPQSIRDRFILYFGEKESHRAVPMARPVTD